MVQVRFGVHSLVGGALAALLGVSGVTAQASAAPSVSARPVTGSRAAQSHVTRVERRSPSRVVATTTVSSAESQFLILVNRERTTRGLRPLRMQTNLHDYARRHAQEMRNASNLWHDMDAEVGAAPAGWLAIGENVGYHYSVQALHAALMESPGHRANILGSDYNYLGVGVALGGDGRVYVSEDFMQHPSSSLPTLGPNGSSARRPSPRTRWRDR